MSAGIGHNSGLVDEPGLSWRTHAWRKARGQLMPKLPIEVIRRRVARAKELGLPYKTYAGLRASSGDDLIGFMFSSNALGVVRRTQAVTAQKAARIAALRDVRTFALVQGQVAPEQVVPPVQQADAAPRPLAPWPEVRDHLTTTFRRAKLPASRTVLVCDTALEREWVEAGCMAGALPAAAFFDAHE